MTKPSGLVFSIERSSIHDGPGIRTTVFLKGCPLQCLWCHNPESQSFSPELYFLNEKCTLCGGCARVCTQGCHLISGDSHIIDRTSCRACKSCIQACPYSALEMKGERMDAEAVLDIVLQDKDYYEASGGGLTLSGGEPHAQLDFAYQVLSLAKENGIHTCVETCGHVPADRIIQVSKVTDIFLYDYKESDTEKHRVFTGADNALILTNLYALDDLGAGIILRCPIIPGLNDREDHLLKIAHLAESLKNIQEINIMPYHPMGGSKSRRIGKEYPLEGLGFAEKNDVAAWTALIRNNTRVRVKKG